MTFYMLTDYTVGIPNSVSKNRLSVLRKMIIQIGQGEVS